MQEQWSILGFDSVQVNASYWKFVKCVIVHMCITNVDRKKKCILAIKRFFCQMGKIHRNIS